MVPLPAKITLLRGSPKLSAQLSFRLYPFFPACFPGLSSLQDGSGSPVGAAHHGFPSITQVYPINI